MPNNTISGGSELIDAKKVFKKLGIAQGMLVADLGCGSAGHFVFPAASMVGDTGTVYAVDILKTVLQGIESRAKLELFSNVHTLWSNLEIYEATDIGNNKVDIAMVNTVLFQTKKHGDVLKEAARVIKPGGKLLVIDWKITAAPLGPPVEDRVKPEEVIGLAEKLGLQEPEEFDAGPYHYGLIFIK